MIDCGLSDEQWYAMSREARANRMAVLIGRKLIDDMYSIDNKPKPKR